MTPPGGRGRETCYVSCGGRSEFYERWKTVGFQTVSGVIGTGKTNCFVFPDTMTAGAMSQSDRRGGVAGNSERRRGNYL